MAVGLELFRFGGRLTPIFTKLGCTYWLMLIEVELAVGVRERDLVVQVVICKSYLMHFFPSGRGHVNLH